MYIKSMVIDGFKTFGQRTEINGFDCEFNGITGLNGSGKSNILDAICFVLGKTNLRQVRAGSLQELVYKNGEAGITKASVTITFDNRDTNKSPLGYERLKEIIITRQAEVAGEDIYMINGSTVEKECVNDLFNSVQLDVNSPHFLIMQGRLTKVLNMKPPEILSLIEEAAGTGMYETQKKQAIQKIIEKNDAKLEELSEFINEVIGSEFMEEGSQHLKLQKISREVQHLCKILVPWLYNNEEAKSRKAQQTLENLDENISELQQKIAEGEHEEVDIESHIQVIRRKRDNECASFLAELERKLNEAEEHVAKVSATDFESQNLAMKDLKSSIETQQNIQESRGNVEQLKEDAKELATEIVSANEAKKNEARRRISKLKELKAMLSSIVNTRTMNRHKMEEKQYNEIIEMKQISMRHKEEIIAVTEEFDKKKKEALRLAWEQVNKNFGSIFGSLLPGAQAKLKPPDGKDILDGLEVTVGFNGLWKDSLQELGDGQSSLVALSLILATLLFNPSPIYILDDVDAALDLSQTQNIGQMLKVYFKHLQFIVVSMKDVMFNNANVLFRTKIVDGMSTVMKTTPGQK